MSRKTEHRTVDEVSAYARERDKLATIQTRHNSIDAEIQEAIRQRGVVSGGQVTALLDAPPDELPEIAPLRDIDTLYHERETLRATVLEQRKRTDLALAEARKAVAKTYRPDYVRSVERLLDRVQELAAAVEDHRKFMRDMPGGLGFGAVLPPSYGALEDWDLEREGSPIRLWLKRERETLERD